VGRTPVPVVMLRNSERQSFKKCMFMWALNFGVLTGTPLKPTEDARALRFGDLIHQSLAGYYKRGKKRGRKPWLIFEKLYKQQIEELEMGRLNMKDEDKWLDAMELGPAMLRGLVERYGPRDEQYEVLSAEQVFQVPLKIKKPDGPTTKVLIVGTLDGVWRDLSGPARSRDIFFKEWKTAGSIDLTNLPFDEQAGTYWTYAPKWLWRQGMLPEGVYPSHILYTFMLKSMPDDRPKDEAGRALNKDGSVSKKQPAKRFDRQPVHRDAADRASMHARVIQEVLDMERVRENPALRAYKNPGPLYMPNCRGCPFRDPCELHESGHDWKAMLDSGFQSWDPYAAHELPERW
jgi:hypothetical protein